MASPVPRKPIFTVENLPTLKVISDPLRIQLMDLINEQNDRGACPTVKQLAEALQQTPHKLYYHINLLEKHALIRVERTQIVSGIIEKHYALTARQIQIDKDLFNQSESSQEKTDSAVALFDAAAQTTRQDFITLMQSTKAEREHLASFSGRGAHFTQERIRLTAAQARDFQARLLALTEAFSGLQTQADEEDTAAYNLLTVFIPSLRSRG